MTHAYSNQSIYDQKVRSGMKKLFARRTNKFAPQAQSESNPLHDQLYDPNATHFTQYESVKAIRRRRKFSKYSGLISGVKKIGLFVLIATPLAAISQTETFDKVIKDFRTTAINYSISHGMIIKDIVHSQTAYLSKSDIIKSAGIMPGDPTLMIDTTLIAENLAKNPWIKSAHAKVSYPDKLAIILEEQTPLAWWHHNGKIELVSSDGTILSTKSKSELSHLPVITSDDDTPPLSFGKLSEQLKSYESEINLSIEGAARIKKRRWDIYLQNGIQILMPEDKEISRGISDLARLQEQQDLSKLALKSIDLRIPGKAIIQLKDTSNELIHSS